jgi:signal transduction histidine kinase
LSQVAPHEEQILAVATNNLDRIHGTARELTRAMDEIVWAVNPQHDTLDSLANYLSRFALDFLNASKVRCRLDVPLQLPKLPVAAEVRHNLFLAFKEVLHNVVKHSAASEVHFKLMLTSQTLELLVADNGCGFPEGVAAAGPAIPGRLARGNGQTNIQQRLAEIGGACEIYSEAGRGTNVKFSVPLRA